MQPQQNNVFLCFWYGMIAMSVFVIGIETFPTFFNREHVLHETHESPLPCHGVYIPHGNKGT
jgi:hypothetical protein